MVDPALRKEVEQATLRTFQEEIPSIYFSDKTDAEFEAYSRNAAYTYRQLFKFPPQMFAGASLIDFGAGTGENTVSLARWGATCTLVEMNEHALAIARRVFERWAGGGDHTFVHSSIFDFTSTRTFDIVHCRGVLSHTADKEGAFARIARHVKPGGFLIFGDPNKAGGFQNMLQRYAVYRFARTPDEMVDVCERLFKEDIDRSQHFVHRTRRSIIFDRWVIQSQDDPSVAEVLSWIGASGLQLYSSYPPFLLPLVGDSVHHQPKFDAALVHGMAMIAETVWLLQKEGDVENVAALDSNHVAYAHALGALTRYVENFNAQSSLEPARFFELAEAARRSCTGLRFLSQLQDRFVQFIDEATEFVRTVERGDVDEVRAYIAGCRHLFKGACGVRHVDFVAYRPEP
jgi:2-polyprenyl-3-methyl-5-hydroxy-6-metoxy-1,4-benzoquinol methylase